MTKHQFFKKLKTKRTSLETSLDSSIDEHIDELKTKEATAVANLMNDSFESCVKNEENFVT